MGRTFVYYEVVRVILCHAGIAILLFTQCLLYLREVCFFVNSSPPPLR